MAKGSPARTKKVASLSSHPIDPKYQEMIRNAVAALKERKGSSRQAIKKYLKTTYELPDNNVTNNSLRLAINKGVDGGIFRFPKGPSGTIKLAKSEKQDHVKSSEQEDHVKSSEQQDHVKSEKQEPSHPRYEEMIRGKFPSHPKYEEMIRDAIIALKDREGSSRQDIRKYIITTYKLADNGCTSKRFRSTIKKGVKKGIFFFPHGPSGGVKLVELENQDHVKLENQDQLEKQDHVKLEKQDHI